MHTTQTHTAYLAQTLLFTAKGYEFPLQLPSLPHVQGSAYTTFKTKGNTPDMFVLYPNPAADQARLNYKLPSNQSALLTLYDINGRILHTATLTGNGTHTISTQMLENGIYYYTVATNGVILQRQKLLILK